MYATLYGKRKIQFFYNILFWVGRVKAPAIILLGIWVTKEIVQMIGVDSNVNFLAHLGGLLSGALIAFYLLRYTNTVNHEYMDANDNLLKHKILMSEGIQFLGEMNFSKAKYAFTKVLIEEPNNIEAIEYLYKICSHDPSTDDYHRYAKKLILESIRSTNFDLMYETWSAYCQNAVPNVKFNFEDYKKLVNQLLQHKKQEDAEKLILRLFKQASTKPDFATWFLHLAHHYQVKRDQQRTVKYAKAIIKHFPDSEELAHAQTLLTQMHH